MTKQETIEYICNRIQHYYDQRTERGWFSDKSYFQDFKKMLLNIEGLEELFTPLRQLDELPYSHESGGRNLEEAGVYHSQFVDAFKKYPIAAKVYNINVHTMTLQDTVTPKLKQLIAKYG